MKQTSSRRLRATLDSYQNFLIEALEKPRAKRQDLILALIYFDFLFSAPRKSLLNRLQRIAGSEKKRHMHASPL